MPIISRGRALAYFVVALAALVLGGRLLIGHDAESRSASGETFTTLETGSTSSGIAPAVEHVVVHVVGAVRRPGLYRLAQGSRVDDAIRKAGGAKSRAALELVNLAAPLADGEQVVVPARGRAGPVAASGTTTPAGPVHLNTATLEELDGLPGVGPVTAQKILDYRAKHGAFSSVDELDAIPGIGPARLEQLRELVTP